MYFRTLKLRFEHFFVNCKVKMTSFKQFILCSNLYSKLEKSCFKEAIFILQLAKKKLKKQFFGAKIHIFENHCSHRLQFFCKLIPNLLGHPVYLFIGFHQV